MGAEQPWFLPQELVTRISFAASSPQEQIYIVNLTSIWVGPRCRLLPREVILSYYTGPLSKALT
jgi:hypothetical protein